MTSDWLSAPLPDQGGQLSEIDTSVPHIARVYDYWLGGKDNFAPDRAVAEAAMREDPNVVEGVRGNRAFLARAVRYLAGQAGVRQFLDRARSHRWHLPACRVLAPSGRAGEPAGAHHVLLHATTG